MTDKNYYVGCRRDTIDNFGKGLGVLTLSQTSPGFYVSSVKVLFENNVGKGKIARNEQFIPFPQSKICRLVMG